jgi:hypothetical protein
MDGNKGDAGKDEREECGEKEAASFHTNLRERMDKTMHGITGENENFTQSAPTEEHRGGEEKERNASAQRDPRSIRYLRSSRKRFLYESGWDRMRQRWAQPIDTTWR